MLILNLWERCLQKLQMRTQHQRGFMHPGIAIHCRHKSQRYLVRPARRSCMSWHGMFGWLVGWLHAPHLEHPRHLLLGPAIAALR